MSFFLSAAIAFALKPLCCGSCSIMKVVKRMSSTNPFSKSRSSTTERPCFRTELAAKK